MRKIRFLQALQQAKVTLNEQQLTACLHVDQPLLLLAAPGTGKTTTTIAKIGYLLYDCAYQPHEILAVTFSRAAAQDMRQRFMRFFPQLPPVTFLTIHALALQIIRATQMPFQLIDGEFSEKRRIFRQLYRAKYQEYPSEEVVESIESYCGLIKNLHVTPTQFTTIAKERGFDIVKGAEEVYEAYETYKQNHQPQLIDYDDMLTEALRILETDAHVRQDFTTRFRFILVDEAQDTSVVQHAIIEWLAEPHQKIYMVADDDQSIYQFRGSDVTQLFDFTTRYPTGKTLTLTQNYRSTQQIVKTANQFIPHVSKRFAKKMTTMNEEGVPPRIVLCQSHHEQMTFILHLIKAQPYANTAVLYRNNASSIAVAHMLMEENIPFYVKDVYGRFFTHFIMQDLRNYLRLAYGSQVKHYRIIDAIRPRFKGYVKKEHIAQLAEKDPQANLWETLRTLPQMQPYQIRFFEKCEKIFPTLQDKTPSDAIQAVLYELDYYKQLEKYISFMKMNEEACLRILSTIQLIAQSAKTLVAFFTRLDELEQQIRQSKQQYGQEAVTLSTFHSSKGLEFDQVLLIDVQEGQVPTFHEVKAFEDNKAALDEPLRLFYVAMTRAKTQLHIFATKRHPSSFLAYVK